MTLLYSYYFWAQFPAKTIPCDLRPNTSTDAKEIAKQIAFSAITMSFTILSALANS